MKDLGAVLFFVCFAVRLFVLVNNQKTGKSCDFSGLVEQVLEISNGFIEGFKKTIGFKITRKKAK